jgi:hypothetical protein
MLAAWYDSHMHMHKRVADHSDVNKKKPQNLEKPPCIFNKNIT